VPFYNRLVLSPMFYKPLPTEISQSVRVGRVRRSGREEEGAVRGRAGAMDGTVAKRQHERRMAMSTRIQTSFRCR